MQERIEGAPLPVLEVGLDAGESVVAEIGEFSWMSDGVAMQTGAGGGGLRGAFKRAVAGGSVLLTTYTATVPGLVAFAAKVPGSILAIDLGPGQDYVVHRHGFLAGPPGIEISFALQQTFRGGVFGGEGFVLQRLRGAGRAWVELSGHVSEYTLAPGQVLRVHPGHVGMLDSSVSFTVERVKGMANRYLGDDGHHFVVLRGPGRVWLQSMPLPILAGALAPYLPSGQGAAGLEGGVAGGSIGRALGDFLGS